MNATSDYTETEHIRSDTKSEDYLVVSDDGVELAEGGEAEEGVDYVGRQVDRGLPLLPEIGE